ncbi:hypothetical protein HanLR1_Chr16g0607021 [Helianthus annuus]|nr:hypothetical protein HanHA89_Chr16g0645891 [Helianthus annuus]KAJ0639727.1 hypothetical protein HanLR1_Chr16g0607021 [Helianthus annuus]
MDDQSDGDFEVVDQSDSDVSTDGMFDEDDEQDTDAQSIIKFLTNIFL